MGTMARRTRRYAGPRKTGTPTRSECPYKGCGMGAVELRGPGEREVAWLGLWGDQHPDGVAAECGAEGQAGWFAGGRAKALTGPEFGSETVGEHETPPTGKKRSQA